MKDIKTIVLEEEMLLKHAEHNSRLNYLAECKIIYFEYVGGIPNRSGSESKREDMDLNDLNGDQNLGEMGESNFENIDDELDEDLFSMSAEEK